MMSSCAARRSAKASCSSVWTTSGVIASKQEAVRGRGLEVYWPRWDGADVPVYQCGVYGEQMQGR